MTDINLAIVDLDQFPEGWIETKGGKKRTQIGVGDVAASFAGFYGASWRFNLLSNRIELAGTPVKPQEIELLYSELALKGWTVSKNAAIDGARAAAYANSFNPVQEYLERIASDDSITPVDLNTIATTYFDTKDPLYDAMVRATLIGAVRRTFDPGCLYRTVLVFKGPQDIGKSSVVRNLASPDWVSDTSHDNDKDFMLSVHSAWIIELAELDSITSKKEAGKLKNLISSPKDSLRPPYGRAIETFPRRSILIGTSNRDDFLRDETGSSRWWVVELPHNADRGFHINHDRIRRDRDAIWKAASGGGGGSGTVTSVNMSVPTGFAISGNPITGSGTLALAFASGYSLPTTTKQGQWDTAYGWGDHSAAGYLTSAITSGPIPSPGRSKSFLSFTLIILYKPRLFFFYFFLKIIY